MGRSAIYLVIGFTFVFLMSSRNLSTVSTEAFKNAIQYYENSTGHQIVQTGANFACNQLFLTPNWRDGYQNVAFAGGTFTVTAAGIAGTDQVQLVSTASYDGKTYTIKILLQPSLFSKFAYYSDNEPNSIYWVTGDTVWGPYHSNTKMYVNGNPVFNGKTTNLNGLVKKNGNADHPQFNGGYETGISISMPSDLSTIKGKATQAGGGLYLSSPASFAAGTDIYMTFNANGTVTYKIGAAGVSTTTDLATLAGTNKVIVIEGGNLRIKGTLSGQVSIAALGSSGSTTQGHVMIDSSIVYNNNPLAGVSTDMLGIVATNDIMITDNVANNTAAGVKIQGTMFSLAGGFGAENYDTRPAMGSIQLLGGVSQHIRRAVGTSGSPGTGFKKSYKYDERMLVTSPPCYPTTGSYEVLEWLE